MDKTLWSIEEVQTNVFVGSSEDWKQRATELRRPRPRWGGTVKRTHSCNGKGPKPSWVELWLCRMSIIVSIHFHCVTEQIHSAWYENVWVFVGGEMTQFCVEEPADLWIWRVPHRLRSYRLDTQRNRWNNGKTNFNSRQLKKEAHAENRDKDALTLTKAKDYLATLLIHNPIVNRCKQGK